MNSDRNHWSFSDDPINLIEVGHYVDEVSDFASRVEKASRYFCIAYNNYNVVISPPRRHNVNRHGLGSVFHHDAADIAWRAALIAKMLRAEVDPHVAQSPLIKKAVELLVDNEVSSHYLLTMLDSDHMRAFHELADLVAAEGTIITKTARHLAAIEDAKAAEESHKDKYDEAVANLIEQAGGTYGLAEAAALMNISKAALHKAIRANRALGFMRSERIVLPCIQFSDAVVGVPLTVIDGLPRVLKLFAEANEDPVRALQWLMTRHGILKDTPIAALKTGNTEQVTHLARGFLQLDGAP
jgi:hypothetical protein